MNYSTQVDGAVEFEVNSLYEARLKVLDKRKARGKRYGLASVLRLSVLAKLGGEDEPEGMADRVKQRGQALRESLGMKRENMPHAVTYRRLLGQAIDVAELEQGLGSFFKGCQAKAEQLARDGKTLRGTIERGQTRGVHLLAVYGVEAGVVLNQVNVLSKENEISAAPKVLAGVELTGQVVTGAALFRQRDLSGQIVEAGGQYLWRVKDNQASLRADIERLFGPESGPLGSAPLAYRFSVCQHDRQRPWTPGNPHAD